MQNIIKQQKDKLRGEYLSKRRAMDAAEKLRRDSAICRAATGLVSFRYAEYVLMYAPTDDEIDVTGIAQAAFAKGKKVCFPRCDKMTHTMQYHIVTSMDELIPDSYNIAEPTQDSPIYDPEHDQAGAICFVPGLVYDRAGYRLGYGKGFYDRYLNSFSGSKIGIVYSDYILPFVPRGRFDVKVDILLTEKGVKTSEN